MSDIPTTSPLPQIDIIGSKIEEAARQGKAQVEVGWVHQDALTWLEVNDFSVWYRVKGGDERTLIGWEDAQW